MLVPFSGKSRRESTPERPPRRRCSRGEEFEANGAAGVSPATGATGRIKSILKKPCASDEPLGPHHRTVVDVTIFASPPASADASPETVAADAPCSSDCAATGDLSGSRRRRPHTAACCCPADQLRRRTKIGAKIKKQVQFKGMRGDTGDWSGGSGGCGAGQGVATSTTNMEEDESGSRLTDGANATAETGYAIDLSITETAVAAAAALGSLCDSRPSRRLECDLLAGCSAALQPSASTGHRPPSSVDPRPSPTHPFVPRQSAPSVQIVTVAPGGSTAPPPAQQHPTSATTAAPFHAQSALKSTQATVASPFSPPTQFLVAASPQKTSVTTVQTG